MGFQTKIERSFIYSFDKAQTRYIIRWGNNEDLQQTINEYNELALKYPKLSVQRTYVGTQTTLTEELDGGGLVITVTTNYPI